jgi:hypothetical protein
MGAHRACFHRSGRQSHSRVTNSLQNNSFLSCVIHLRSRTNRRALGINYVFGVLLERLTGRAASRAILALAVVANLALIAVFKYSSFFVDNLNVLLLRRQVWFTLRWLGTTWNSSEGLRSKCEPYLPA